MNFILKYRLVVISCSVDRLLKKDPYSFCFKSRCVKLYCFGPAWVQPRILDAFCLFHLQFLLFEIDLLVFFVVINIFLLTYS